MNRYAALADDFYVNMNLSTEMELPQQSRDGAALFRADSEKISDNAEVLLPRKARFRAGGRKRSLAIPLGHRRKPPRVFRPGESRELEEALEQHRLVLELAPYMLSVSPLDCEALDLLYGFDFTYRGNHNQLVAEALGVSPALERLLDIPGATVINYEPSLTLSLDESCRTPSAG